MAACLSTHPTCLPWPHYRFLNIKYHVYSTVSHATAYVLDPTRAVINSPHLAVTLGLSQPA